MKKTRPAGGRKRQRTNPVRTDDLIEYGLLDFLQESRFKLRFQQFDSQAECLEKSELHLSEDTRTELDKAAKTLDKQSLYQGELANLLTRIIQAICAKDRVIDFQVFVESSRYVCRRLGVPDTVLLKERITGETSMLSLRSVELMSRNQASLFREWVGINDAIWHDSSWREAMLLRYGHQSTKPIDWIDQDLKAGLKTIVKEFRAANSGKVPDDQAILERILHLKGVHLIGHTRLTVARLHVRNDLEHDAEIDNMLRTSVSQNRFYEMLAETLKQRLYPAMPSFYPASEEQSFLRYLKNPTGLDEVTGRIIRYMLRIETFLDDPFSSGLPTPLEKKWPAYLTIKNLAPPKEFVNLGDCCSKYLRIPTKVFSDIWSAYLTITFRTLAQRRSPANLAIFWAAEILKVLRADVYKAYKAQVTNFLRQLAQESGKSDPILRSAIVELFIGAMRSNPLLRCVFHTEVLKGHKNLVFRPGKKGPNEQARNLTLGFAYWRLEGTLQKDCLAIEQFLSKCPDLKKRLSGIIPQDYATRKESVDVGPRSVYAYLVAVDAALCGAEILPLTPVAARLRCLTARHHPLVLSLRDDLSREFASAIRME